MPIVIRIVEYDPGWPAVFATHAAAIRRALQDAALAIEHVGSTAVEGLAAKPIVDILLVVHDSADESSYLPALDAAGYRLRIREPEFHEHRLLKPSSEDVHLHVFSPDSPEIARLLRFRDRLRANATDRQWYEDAKRHLAGRTWQDMDEYASAKTSVVERILAHAMAEHQAERSAAADA